MRSFGKATILALATLTASAALNCSGESHKNIPSDGVKNAGSVGLELQIAPGINIDTVSYTITGPNGYSSTGSINVANSTTISALIGGIPAGTGYTITLNANSTNDSGVVCVGQANFNVTANTTTPVTVHLQCRKPGNGSIIINGTVNVCPTIDSIGASPTSVNVGGAITLTSAGSDSDGVPSPISFAWSEGSTSFATTANATYNCAVAGSHTLTLRVTDGDPGCEDTGTVTVNCVNGGGGAGGAAGTGGAGGAAGTGGSTGGSAGTGGSTGGTAGTGGSTGGSAGTGGSTGGTAGTGGSTGGTAGTGGSTGGTAGTGGSTGGTAGTGGSTGGTAGTGGSAGAPGDGGSTITTRSILEANSLDCYACSASGGELSSDCDLATIGCETFTDPAQRAQCLAVLACVLPAGTTPPSCISPATVNLTPCYCGTVPTGDCSSGAAPGAGQAYGECKALMEAGFPGLTPSQIAAGIANITYPSGRAMKIAQCAGDILGATGDTRCGTCF